MTQQRSQIFKKIQEASSAQELQNVVMDFLSSSDSASFGPDESGHFIRTLEDRFIALHDDNFSRYSMCLKAVFSDSSFASYHLWHQAFNNAARPEILTVQARTLKKNADILACVVPLER